MTWRIAKGLMPCGSCGTRIRPGEAFGAIELAGTRRARCFECASLFVGFCPFVVQEPVIEAPISWQPLLPGSLPAREGPSVDVRAQLGRLRDQIFGAPA